MSILMELASPRTPGTASGVSEDELEDEVEDELELSPLPSADVVVPLAADEPVELVEPVEPMPLDVFPPLPEELPPLLEPPAPPPEELPDAPPAVAPPAA